MLYPAELLVPGLNQDIMWCDVTEAKRTLVDFSDSSSSFLRRERDSNPRYRFWQYTRLASEHLRPLGHLSRASSSYTALQFSVRAASAGPVGAGFSSGALDSGYLTQDRGALASTYCNGGGGIRTPGAFALRFSRPLPSTTRPLLPRLFQTPAGDFSGSTGDGRNPYRGWPASGKNYLHCRARPRTLPCRCPSLSRNAAPPCYSVKGSSA